MTIGLVTDLAVGVHPAGAEVWTLGPALARGLSVGAPPDAFNQIGQNWSQPPWRPDVLAELGYAPYRAVLRAALRHAGGLRIDHVMGLFRLWCIPEGARAAEGAYLRYDHEAMVSILLLEAERAGAFVVGEDLGVVEPFVRDYLAERGVLGTSILWFEVDDGRPRPPETWRELCLATVTTHDLPPTAGYLLGEHVRLRESLGLLTRPVDEELAVSAREREVVLAELRRRGLLAEGADEQEIVEALHDAADAGPAPAARRQRGRPGRRPAYPEPAGHAPRVPQLADPALRPRRPAAAAGGPGRRCRGRAASSAPLNRGVAEALGCRAWPCGSWRAARTRRSSTLPWSTPLEEWSDDVRRAAAPRPLAPRGADRAPRRPGVRRQGDGRGHRVPRVPAAARPAADGAAGRGAAGRRHRPRRRRRRGAAGRAADRAPAVLAPLPQPVLPRPLRRQPAVAGRRARRAAGAAPPRRVLLGRRVALQRAVPPQRRRLRRLPRRRRDRRAAGPACPARCASTTSRVGCENVFAELLDLQASGQLDDHGRRASRSSR